MSELSQVRTTVIDPEGTFKYVLIKVTDSSNNTKVCVRGNARGAYHADIYDEFEKEIAPLKLKSSCIGGGRIEHKPQADPKYIKVYGYSQGYGKADHEVTVETLKKEYPGYSITWSNEGY